MTRNPRIKPRTWGEVYQDRAQYDPAELGRGGAAMLRLLAAVEPVDVDQFDVRALRGETGQHRSKAAACEGVPGMIAATIITRAITLDSHRGPPSRGRRSDARSRSCPDRVAGERGVTVAAAAIRRRACLADIACPFSGGLRTRRDAAAHQAVPGGDAGSSLPSRAHSHRDRDRARFALRVVRGRVTPSSVGALNVAAGTFSGRYRRPGADSAQNERPFAGISRPLFRYLPQNR